MLLQYTGKLLLAARAFSQYLYYTRRGIIKKSSFEEALRLRPDFVERSSYFRQVKRYFDLFPRKNILVLFYGDLERPDWFFKQALDFLEVEDFRPSGLGKKVNYASQARFPAVNRTISSVKRFFRGRNLNFPLLLSKKLGISKFLETIQRNNAREFNTYPEMNPKTKASADQVAKAFNGLSDGRHQFKARATQTKSLWLTVKGMSKDKDAKSVAKRLERVKGVKAALADARAGSAVVFLGEQIKPEALIAAVATAGSFHATLEVKDETKRE